MTQQRASVSKRASGLTYDQAGVSIAMGDRFVEMIQSRMRRTFGPRVIENPGGFAGKFRLDYNEKLFKRNYRDPVLVACADGVGTKVKIAAAMDRFDTIGVDLVAMNVNDLVVESAEPLFFLDYIATGSLDPHKAVALLEGVARGCEEAGCALLGGETAEMPDVYAPGEMDLAGFAVGVVELARATAPERVEPGDVVLGLASSGPHSNGYSLIRKALARGGIELRDRHPLLPEETTVGQALLTPTRIYAGNIVRVLRTYKVKKVVTGMAHITGGGLVGNLKRALHEGVDACIDRRRLAEELPPQPVFQLVAEAGDIDEEEMRRVFNMGVGFCLIVRPTFAEAVARKLRKRGEKVAAIGTIVEGAGAVRLV
ncbi:MAG: phosphoribosylformylglycinamidine cyclo-ligase [Planctomycetota bacterium]|nr:MAG: phosphoribosylformylglycinamidine cyclo-ligase [Planctomycetota bacterium]